jgi:hypothetical protein
MLAMNKSQHIENKVDDATDGHPVATGVGAVAGGLAGGVAGGAAAGAAVGGVTGPVGAAIGAAVGAVAGGLMGRGAGKALNPKAEDEYWRENYTTRPYVTSGSTYDDYGPAYRYGVDAYSRYPDRKFDDLDVDLSRDWPTARGSSNLEWDRASDTVERATPGDSDRDGK